MALLFSICHDGIIKIFACLCVIHFLDSTFVYSSTIYSLTKCNGVASKVYLGLLLVFPDLLVLMKLRS
jgi:hypothetical protein